MQTVVVILAIVLIVLAIPLVLRIDSAIARRRTGRAILDSARLVAAVAAAAGLLVFACRQR